MDCGVLVSLMGKGSRSIVGKGLVSMMGEAGLDCNSTVFGVMIVYIMSCESMYVA